MQFTAAQSRAVYTTDANLVVVAGAGSGKTRVLVERYIALLDANPTWTLDELVAVTFTQKAAQEMRDRVRSALQARLHAADEHTAPRWARLLATMDSARIDTIHALCGAILRANAAEAKIDPRFQILEPTAAKVLLKQVIERVLVALLDAPTEDAELLRLFQYYKADDVRDALIEFAKLDVPPMPATPDAILNQWQALWAENRQALLMRCAHSAALMDWRVQIAASMGEAPDGDKMTEQGFAVLDALAVLLALPQPPDEDTLNQAERALSQLTQIALNIGSKPKWGGGDVLADFKALLKALRDHARALAAQIGAPPAEIDQQIAEILPLWMGLVARVQAAYTDLKARQDLLDFDDLERRAALLLRTHETVRQRYAQQAFKHLLVDEFQDTNMHQWEIIHALTAPERPLQDGETARLFIVGDPKQSIYGFRGADVRVFEQVRHTLGQSAGGVQEIALVDSFRTQGDLLILLNGIFGQVLQRDEGSLGAAYQVVYEQEMRAFRADAPDAHTPSLALALFDAHAAPPEPEAAEDSADKLNKASVRAWEAAWLAAHIREVVADGTRHIYDKDAAQIRPIAYGDMVMLFQSTREIKVYEEALRAQGVPYLSLGGRGYYNRQEVWDLLSLLEALADPSNALALATVLRSPLFGLSDEALLALRLRSTQNEAQHSLWLELHAAAVGEHPYLPPALQPSVAAAYGILAELRARVGRVTLYELLYAALEMMGYLAVMTALPDGTRRRANVEKLLDMALHSEHVTVEAFTQYLNDMSASSDVRESEAELVAQGAVTLMTVHGSKGLEFPYVIIPSADWVRSATDRAILRAHEAYGLVCMPPIRDDGEKSPVPMVAALIKSLEKARDDAERRRLFYVAATRAQDYLLISGEVSQKDGLQAKGWLGWCLDALGLSGATELMPYQAFAATGVGGRVALQLPAYIPPAAAPPVGESPLWSLPNVRDAAPFAHVPAQSPPLLAAVTVNRARLVRNLAATSIAALGDPQHSQTFKRLLLNNAPAYLTTIPKRQQRDPVPERILGEIVHEALRWWRFPQDRHDTSINEALSSYAWKFGVVEPDHVTFAINTARNWLRVMQRKPLYAQMNSAQRIFRELPFTYPTEERVIHGILDVLYQAADGTWAIVDYKSSRVPNYSDAEQAAAHNKRVLKAHAERYHLQVGVYAAAVQRYLERIGQPIDPATLKIYIYYLRYAHTVEVSYADWTAALGRLTQEIGDLLEDVRL